MLSTRTGKPPIVWWCLCFFCYQSKLGCIVIDLCWKIFQFRYVTEKLSIEIFDNINGSWLPVLSTTLVSVNKQTHVHGLYRKANRLLSWDVSPSNDKAKSFWQQKVSHQISYAQKSIFFSVDLVTCRKCIVNDVDKKLNEVCWEVGNVERVEGAARWNRECNVCA